MAARSSGCSTAEGAAGKAGCVISSSIPHYFDFFICAMLLFIYCLCAAVISLDRLSISIYLFIIHLFILGLCNFSIFFCKPSSLLVYNEIALGGFESSCACIACPHQLFHLTRLDSPTA